MVCLPTIATAALFTAVIVYDLYDRNWSRIPGHGLFGVFATLLMLFICQRTSEWVAWSILAIPIVFCLLASFMRSTETAAKAVAKVDTSCSCCNYNPCRKPKPMPKPKPIPIDPKCPDPEPKPAPAPAPTPEPTPDKCCKPSKSSSSSSNSNWGSGGFYIKTTYE